MMAQDVAQVTADSIAHHDAIDVPGTRDPELDNIAFEKQGYYTRPVDPYVTAKAKHLEVLALGDGNSGEEKEEEKKV